MARKGKEWEVKRIVNDGGSKIANLEYEVKWIGYDKST
jgi:hypothetical protein